MRAPAAVSHIALTVLIATCAVALAAQAKPATGAPLTVQATCDAGGASPVIRVQLGNKGNTPAAVVAGFSAKDKTQVVDSLELITIRAPTGADEVWMYINPKFALAEGPPWIVTLAPGATHEFELPLSQFMSTMTYANLDPVTAAGARLVFQGRRPPKQATPVWTGRVETVVAACGA